MRSSGKNGLNIRTNSSPKWDRTRCPEEQGSSVVEPHPLQCSMETSPNSAIRSKSVIRSSSVIGSQIGVMSEQLRVSL